MSPSDSGSEIFYGETCAQRSVFLAGPTLRKPGAGWRRDAVGMLRAAGYQTDIVLPEWRHGEHDANKAALGWTSSDVVGWEHQNLEAASVILFWMPFCLGEASDPASLPGFTTRLELGLWLARSPRKLVVGMPPECRLAVGAIRYYCRAAGVEIQNDLLTCVSAVTLKLM
jgi:hypothetical protein